MTQSLKLELPLEPSILRANARMLDTIADGLCGPMLPGINDEIKLPETTEQFKEAVPSVPSPEPEYDTLPTPTPETDTIPTPETEVPAPEANIPTPDVDVDNRGMVWDKRIHASSKAKNVDGTWRNKRGVDKTLLAQVEAELLQGEPIPDPDLGTAHLNEPLPEAPAPTAPVTPAPTETAAINTFGDLMAAITRAGITSQQTQEACVKAGVASVALLAARADLIPTVAAELGL